MERTTEEIRAEFEATVKGPGKFESEEPYVPYFWELGLEGGADEEEDDMGLDGDPKPIWVFKITSADRILFPELSGRVQVRIVETHDGFVSELQEYSEGGQPSVEESQAMPDAAKRNLDRKKSEQHQNEIRVLADGKPGAISKLDFLKANPFAWPGGYTLLALMGDGETLCHKCIVGESEIYEGENPPTDGNDPAWQFVDFYVHWEGGVITCANCNAELKSEYGDPDDPNDPDNQPDAGPDPGDDPGESATEKNSPAGWVDPPSEPDEVLIYPPRVFAYGPVKDGTKTVVDYDKYMETRNQRIVGDYLEHFCNPPGLGKIVYRITRMDETGVYGFVVENLSTAKHSDDWNRPTAAAPGKKMSTWETTLAERQIENWQTLVEKSETTIREQGSRMATLESENENLRADLEPMKIWLVYQAGIANVFQVDSFNLSDYGREAKRIAQGGFETCSSIAHGMGLAGSRVRTAGCNRAGEIQSEIWTDDMDSLPFRDQMTILNMANGNHVNGTPVFDEPGPDAETVSVIVRKFDPTGPRVNETLIADRVYNLYRHTEGFNKRILRKGSQVQTQDEIKIGSDWVRVEKIISSDPGGPVNKSDEASASLDDPSGVS